jgi:hypothetical protein
MKRREFLKQTGAVALLATPVAALAVMPEQKGGLQILMEAEFRNLPNPTPDEFWGRSIVSLLADTEREVNTRYWDRMDELRYATLKKGTAITYAGNKQP